MSESAIRTPWENDVELSRQHYNGFIIKELKHTGLIHEQNIDKSSCTDLNSLSLLQEFQTGVL